MTATLAFNELIENLRSYNNRKMNYEVIRKHNILCTALVRVRYVTSIGNFNIFFVFLQYLPGILWETPKMFTIPRDFWSLLTNFNIRFSCCQCIITLPCLLTYSTSMFEWTLEGIGIEKIISAPLRATNFFYFFFEVSILLDVRHSSTLQSCAISRKTNDATLRKWQKP